MLKEGYEDLQRYKQDKEVNHKKAKVCVGDNIVEKFWMDIQVGEMVKVLKDEPFPADLLLLKSSSITGMAFVDTMNLDGEVNYIVTSLKRQ